FVIFSVAEHSFRFAAYRWWGDDVRDFDSGDATLVVRILADVFTLVFAGVYTTVLHTMDGQTIGKMLMGARVVGADGAPLPDGAADETEWLGAEGEGANVLLRQRAESATRALAALPLGAAEPSLAEALARAAVLFDAGLAFEVHELLEPYWVRAHGDEREALQ